MKKYRVIWDERAIKEFQDIYQYLRDEAKVPQAAKQVRDELLRVARDLNTMPKKFKVYEYADKGLGDYRSVVRWHYRIIYEVLREEVHIVRIIHTSRDPDSIKL
ncbi:MAG: type II toxin-antitoxin system RelE/ParE family toxin [Bacteroidota bacterium]